MCTGSILEEVSCTDLVAGWRVIKERNFTDHRMPSRKTREWHRVQWLLSEPQTAEMSKGQVLPLVDEAWFNSGWSQVENSSCLPSIPSKRRDSKGQSHPIIPSCFSQEPDPWEDTMSWTFPETTNSHSNSLVTSAAPLITQLLCQLTSKRNESPKKEVAKMRYKLTELSPYGVFSRSTHTRFP